MFEFEVIQDLKPNDEILENIKKTMSTQLKMEKLSI